MIKIDGLTALELKRAGYKIVKRRRAFFVSENSIVAYFKKRRM
jgi:hypothetical protein